MPVPDFPVYVFDVDGTLMDSAADICGAQRDVLAAAGYQGDLSDAFLRGYIGRHLIDLFGDLGFSSDRIDPMVEHYRSLYTQRGHTNTSVYAGVPQMLAGLGGRKSTATTKGSNSTRAILEQFGLLPHFHHVQGTDGFPAKPEPDVILASIAGLGASRDECLFIGDSPQDMEAGRKAGVRTCAVRWGYGDHSAMAKWEPDFWIDSPADLWRR
jgi:HAD superfamily hydrolase (TIGR01549 family)